jgi:CRP-like cAMP-binding protein
MAGREEIVEKLAGFTLFADLAAPQLEGVASHFEEAWYPDGERILRQGLSGSGFYVILEGTCSIQVDGGERASLGRGDFFGEVSILLGQPPIADVVAVGPVSCLVLAGPAVEPFLLAHPKVMFRMLQALGRRLSSATRWRS